MASAGQIAHETLNNIVSFLNDFTTHMVVKSILAVAVSILSFLFGASDLALFGSLMAMVVMEYVLQLASDTNKAGRGKRFSAFVYSLETHSFSSAVQLVTYGVLTSAAHLTDVIVIGGHYIEDTVISFLAISQLIRIIRVTGKMGYSVPPAFLTFLEEYRAGTVEGEMVRTHVAKEK